MCVRPSAVFSEVSVQLSHLDKGPDGCACPLARRDAHQLPPVLPPRSPAWWSHGEAACGELGWGAGGPHCPWGEPSDQAAEGAESRSLCLGIKQGRQIQPCGPGWWFRKTWSLLLAEQRCGCGQVTWPLGASCFQWGNMACHGWTEMGPGWLGRGSLMVIL